jgi:hypothetical protein
VYATTSRLVRGSTVTIQEMKIRSQIFKNVNSRYVEEIWSRDGSVGTATAYGLDRRGVGVRVLVGTEFLSSSMSSTPVVGPTQPPIQWVLRFSPG